MIATTVGSVERPAPHNGGALFGSDLIAETLRALEIPFIALNPGASYRGLHDSIVNHLGNSTPQILLCLHEEHAVAIAHGFAKVAGRAMAAAVHSNVGLMNATMGIFNAWCDRMPMLVIGATGPLDAAVRRPWIEWIHTARDQGALVRAYVKWDDQPGSAVAARESLLRGTWLANTMPCGPVYINLDVGLQEAALGKLPALSPHGRFLPPVQTMCTPLQLDEILAALGSASRPVILSGRVAPGSSVWRARTTIAEAFGAAVITDAKLGTGFPTDHRLHAGHYESAAALSVLRGADLVLSLDWVDLGGALRLAHGEATPDDVRIIHVSMDFQLHNGWSMDHQAHPPVDVMVAADPDAVAAALATRLPPPAQPAPAAAPPPFVADGTPLTTSRLGRALRFATSAHAVTLLHIPVSWDGAAWPLREPLDYIGSIGGAGLGGSPGIAVGASLALRHLGHHRLPVAVLGDGDFLMGATALWTAAHYHIPLLLVVANNTSFYNDEVHQERVARARGRPPENKWIGQRISEPDVDLAKIASAQGAIGFGPIQDDADLMPALTSAIEVVLAGGVALVDVRISMG